jgi:hypothetical protein
MANTNWIHCDEAERDAELTRLLGETIRNLDAIEAEMKRRGDVRGERHLSDTGAGTIQRMVGLRAEFRGMLDSSAWCRRSDDERRTIEDGIKAQVCEEARKLDGDARGSAPSGEAMCGGSPGSTSGQPPTPTVVNISRVEVAAPDVDGFLRGLLDALAQRKPTDPTKPGRGL